VHGQYRYTKSYPKYNVSKDYDSIALTDCIRDGTRCITVFYDTTGGINPLVFSNGNWNENISYDDSCTSGTTSRMTLTADYPLPQPPADPIPLLTGRGHQEASGGGCVTADFDGKFERTGN
jgi:serine/threonine-protein kinase